MFLLIYGITVVFSLEERTFEIGVEQLQRDGK